MFLLQQRTELPVIHKAAPGALSELSRVAAPSPERPGAVHTHMAIPPQSTVTQQLCNHFFSHLLVEILNFMLIFMAEEEGFSHILRKI